MSRTVRTARMLAACVAALAPAALAAPDPAGAATCADANVPASRATKAAMRTAVVCLVNQQRRLHHLPVLHVSRRLNTSAQNWTNTMVRTGVFSHGADFAGRISASGYEWSFAGENIAAGFPTPRAVVRGWMASTDHCRNILDPDFANVGTGVSARALGPFGGATWTQDFGLWLGLFPPSGNDGPMRHCPYRM
jgi:uncharacterized protein YkwD